MIFKDVLRRPGPLPIETSVTAESYTGEHLLVVAGSVKAIGAGNAGFNVYVDGEYVGQCAKVHSGEDPERLQFRNCFALNRPQGTDVFAVTLQEMNSNTESSEDDDFEIRLLEL